MSDAEYGNQAVYEAAKTKYGTVLMDAVMPGMDGFAACQRIVEKDPDAKVIFLTVPSVVQWVKQALSAGAFSLLKKPVDPDDMISLMKSVVEVDTSEDEGSGGAGRVDTLDESPE